MNHTGRGRAGQNLVSSVNTRLIGRVVNSIAIPTTHLLPGRTMERKLGSMISDE